MNKRVHFIQRLSKSFNHPKSRTYMNGLGTDLFLPISLPPRKSGIH